MKDPAFLFYSSDFLNGVSDLTMEERGQYITLLCLQHQKGELTEKTIRLCIGSVSVDVLQKFTKNEIGNYFNERLKVEIEKRELFAESRRKNGARGGRPTLKKEKDKSIHKPLADPLGYPTNNLMEDVNENEDVIEIKDEKIKIGAICEFFGFSELLHAQNYFETSHFVECLTNRKLITHFYNQFKYYKLVKTESGFKHNFKNFIGSAEKFYEDGAWNAENWEMKVSKKPEKTKFEDVGKNQDEKYKKMVTQFENRR